MSAEHPWGDLFASSTTHAHQHGVGYLDKWAFIEWARAEGYWEAAQLLSQVAVSGKLDPTESDRLVFPIVFLYRHALELKLKELVSEEGDASDTDNLHNHDLQQLWEKARAILEKRPHGRTEPYASRCDDVIVSLHGIDKRSTAFRYAADKKGKRPVPDDVHLIDVAHFAERMEDVLNSLEGWLVGMHEIAQQRAEHQAEHSNDL